MDKKFRTSHNHKRAAIKSKTPSTARSDERINIVIQVRGDPSGETLRVRVPANTSLGKIKKFLAEKYGEKSNYFYLTQLNPKEKNVLSTNSKQIAKSSTSNTKTSSNSYSSQPIASSHGSSIRQKTPGKVNVVFKSAIGEDDEEIRTKVPKGVKIKTLKDALAKKFGLSPEDFELMHIKSTDSN